MFKSVNKPEKQIKGVKPFIVMRSGGTSRFTIGLVREMGLENGGYFDIVNTEDKPLDYYLIVSNSENKKALKLGSRKSPRGNVYEFNCRSMARSFGRFFGIDHKIIKIFVGPKTEMHGVVCWPLITASLTPKI